MGRSHAKNNTTQSTLTYYERSLLRQESAARRIGNESFKPLDHCNLCLSRATLPVSCPRAHVYCRECALTNLIAQKEGIEAQRRELERWEAEDRRKQLEAREAARARVVADFEKGMGLAASARRAAASRGSRPGVDAAATDAVDGAANGANGSGFGNGSTPNSTPSSSTSKFELRDEEIDRIAREAEDKAAALIESEESESRKAKLAAFWLPSLTPEAPLGPLKNVKLQTLCHVGDKGPHAFSRKTLLPVIFTYPTPESERPSCPSCTKELSNATNSVLLTSRTPAAAASNNAKADGGEPKKKKLKKDKEAPAVCGHVVCKTCADTVVKPSRACCVCEAVVEPEGMLPLGKEGTGFAAAGGSIVKKSTVAFRV